MTKIIQAQVEASLAQYFDPYLRQNLVAAKLVQEIQIEEKSLIIKLVYGYPMDAEYKKQLQKSLQAHLAPIAKHVQIEINTKIEIHAGSRGLKSSPRIKNIIAIASGKGGVGKSTTAVNIALALVKEGARVGILDADIYGPSQPTMLGAGLTPELKEKKTLLPIVRHGLQSMSIGYLVDQSAAMIWRGPMVSTALQQLLNDTLWDDLDYLIIDLPPGTGDIQLTMAQKIPVTGAVIVTTPQDLALLDARRAIEMFRKVNVPVLGIIENMSLHTCSHCGHAEALFGEGGGQRIAEESGVTLLGALPLAKEIREETDSGNPTVVANPEGEHALKYRDIARHIAARISLQPKDYSTKFPNIVVQNK